MNRAQLRPGPGTPREGTAAARGHRPTEPGQPSPDPRAGTRSGIRSVPRSSPHAEPGAAELKRKAGYKAPATNYYFSAGLNLKALHRAADKSYILEETIKVLVQELKAQVES